MQHLLGPAVTGSHEGLYQLPLLIRDIRGVALSVGPGVFGHGRRDSSSATARNLRGHVCGPTFAVIHSQEDTAREQELRTHTVGMKTSPPRGENGHPYPERTVHELRLRTCSLQ